MFLPVLLRVGEKNWTVKELTVQIGKDLKLSPDDLALSVPSGTSLITDRVSWAKTYLKKAGLIAQPKRGEVAITVDGLALLAKKPTKLDLATLKLYPSFVAFWAPPRPVGGAGDIVFSGQQNTENTATPDDMILQAMRALDVSLKDALFSRVMDSSASFFERLVIDLLLKMGYGGSDADAGKHVGKSGDGGLDGLISEDKLGLDRIYLQAKRYSAENKIGPEAVQAFLGALVNKNATKGVFITTSSFTNAAVQASHNTNQYRMVLVDGDALMSLLIRHDVGVRVANSLEIKRLDIDYFEPAETE